jgi:hypothetical protein
MDKQVNRTVISLSNTINPKLISLYCISPQIVTPQLDKLQFSEQPLRNQVSYIIHH